MSLVGPVNLHLRGGADAIDAGTDLSGSFTDDIDGQARPQGADWDMGADESGFSGATTYYRSIGTAADLIDAGPITVTAGSAVVTKSGGPGWVAQNRGRGDVLIVGPDTYTILRVVSDDVLTLASLPSAGYGGAYTIARQFTTLQAWENCISGGGTCGFYPLNLGNLVAEDRSEVGIVYEDSVFNETLLIDGSITDDTHGITLTVDPGNRHEGLPGTGARVSTGGPINHAVRIEDDHVTLEWLEVWSTGDYPVRIDGLTTGSNRVVVRNNMIYSNAGPDVYLVNAPGAVLDVYNNIIYDNFEDGVWLDEFGGWVAGASIRILNNTLYNNSDYGVVSLAPWNAEVLIRNNLSFGNTDPDFSANGADQDHNLSEDGSATGPNSLPNRTALQVAFELPGSGDLHLQTGSQARGAGQA